MDLMMIRTYSEKYKGGLKKLAQDIGMSEANLHRCININKIQASDLENIAMKLGVNVSSFFDNQVDMIENDMEINNLKQEIISLKQEIIRLQELKLPTKDDKALDVSRRFFEATKEMFSYFEQIKE